MKDGRPLRRTTEMASSYWSSPSSCPTEKSKLAASFMAVEIDGTDSPRSTLDRLLFVSPETEARSLSVRARCLRRKAIRPAKVVLGVLLGAAAWLTACDAAR